MPRRAVFGDLVVVPCLGREPVAGDPESRRTVKCPCRDADRLTPRRIPEQARATFRAEPAPCARIAARTLNPPKAAIVEEHKVFLARRRARRGVAMPPPALRAMTDE